MDANVGNLRTGVTDSGVQGGGGQEPGAAFGISVTGHRATDQQPGEDASRDQVRPCAQSILPRLLESGTAALC